MSNEANFLPPSSLHACLRQSLIYLHISCPAVCVRNNEQFPADLVLLSTGVPEGAAYVETSNLDRETNLKLVKAQGERERGDGIGGGRCVLNALCLMLSVLCSLWAPLTAHSPSLCSLLSAHRPPPISLCSLPPLPHPHTIPSPPPPPL